MVHVLCPPSALLCERWESGYAAPLWSDPQGTGLESATTVVADGARPHTGAMSSHTAVPGATQGARWRTAPFTAITSGQFALRAYVWFSATPSAAASIVNVTSNVVGSGYALGATAPAAASPSTWTAELRNSVSNSSHPSNVPIQSGRWSCLEFTYDLATQKGVIYVDGQQAVSFTEVAGKGGGPVPSAFDHVLVGTTSLTSTAMDVFVDDLAIGAQRFDDCF